MAKLMIKAIGLLALTIAYATGAWAACTSATDPSASQLEVCVVGGPTYASDLFGPGSDELVLGYMDVEASARVDGGGADDTPCMAAGTNGPNVVIELPDGQEALSGGAEITFTVMGAEFAGRVRNTDLVAKHNGGDIEANVIEGGGVGDDTVTFDVTADALVYAAAWVPQAEGGSLDCLAANHARETGDEKALLAFMVPELRGASGAITTAAGVRVSVDVDPTGAGFPVYPARGQDLPDSPADADMDREKDTAGVRTLLKQAKNPGLKVAAMDGDEGTISPEARNTLVGATGLPSKPQQLSVGSVTVTVDAGVAQSNGSPYTVANEPGRRNDGDGAGVLMISMTGDFNDGDMVFLDDGNAKYDSGAETDTMLKISGGMATAEFGLDDEEISGGAKKLYYVPNGKDPLRSGSIATTYSVEFSNETNVTPRAAMSRSELNYMGARDALLAYAIAPPSNPDQSNIRIRCDRSTPCQVYLACDGADGMGYFGKMDDMIGARMVETVTAMELADTIGADDADFMGRMSCEVIGTSISVQVLTRSGDALVNNTYVGGPIEAQVRQAITKATDAANDAAVAKAGAEAETKRCEAVVEAAPVDDADTPEENERNNYILERRCAVPSA